MIVARLRVTDTITEYVGGELGEHVRYQRETTNSSPEVKISKRSILRAADFEII